MNRLPQRWFEKFEAALDDRPYVKNVKTRFVPCCDFHEAARLAMHYVADDGTLETRRKRRGRVLGSALRAEARSSPSQRDGISLILAKVPEAYSTKRMGVARNQLWLLVLREYLDFRCGIRPGPSDLAVMIEAARVAWGWKKSNAYIDPGQVAAALKRVERNNPKFCLLLTASISSLTDWLEGGWMRSLLP